jgi:hypothetical protein
MINYLLNEQAIVKRRTDVSVASRDSFNSPIYGTPTTNWSVIYSALPCRFAFSKRKIEFKPTGERVEPQGVLYYPADYTIGPEDRIINSAGVEYVVTSTQIAYQTPNVISHMEADIELP